MNIPARTINRLQRGRGRRNAYGCSCSYLGLECSRLLSVPRSTSVMNRCGVRLRIMRCGLGTGAELLVRAKHGEQMLRHEHRH